MFVMSERMNPREQGDLGELSAMEWLASRGAVVFKPVFHSPDVDLVAGVDGKLIRVEVKTSTVHRGRTWCVSISTRGGYQSWSGTVKKFDPTRCEFLFALVGDGRRWLIPTQALECHSSVHLGGPKYAEYEVDPGRPLLDRALDSRDFLGEYRSGQTGCAVNALAQPSQVRILSPPSDHHRAPERRPVERSRCERKPAQHGRAFINYKRRMTVPQSAFFDAGFDSEANVIVRCEGPGRIVVEAADLPSWARSATTERDGEEA